MNGCNMVRPPSKAAYRVSMALFLASSVPSWNIDLEFSWNRIAMSDLYANGARCACLQQKHHIDHRTNTDR